MVGVVGPMTIMPDGTFAVNVRTDTYTNQHTFAAPGTAENFQVPTGSKYVIFGATGNFCVRYNATTTGGTAADFADTTDGSGCPVNPTIRFLNSAIKAISVKVLVTNAAVSMDFYKQFFERNNNGIYTKIP